MIADTARLTALQFRRKGQQSVLRVYFEKHGEEYYHDLPNGMWTIDNVALQFMAKWGYKPSDIGDDSSTMRDCMDDTLALSVVDSDGQYKLSQMAMSGAETALRNAEWFGGADDSEKDETPQRPIGGGSIDKDGGPSIRLSDEDSDSGVTVDVTD